MYLVEFFLIMTNILQHCHYINNKGKANIIINLIP